MTTEQRTELMRKAGIPPDPSYTQIMPYDWEEHELEHDGKISDTCAHPSMIGRVATKMIRSVVPDWVFNVLHKL